LRPPVATAAGVSICFIKNRWSYTMLIGHIEGATRIIGKSQGYLGLPVRDVTLNCSVNGDATPAMVTAWHPTPDELAALMAGAAIHVQILGQSHPPIMVGVGLEPDAG
jgi:hypothetical protein